MSSDSQGERAVQDFHRKCNQSSSMLAGGWVQGLLVDSNAATSCLALDTQPL